MTQTSEAGQQALGLYAELKPQVDLLSDRVVATAGIAHHADETADAAHAKALEALQKVEVMQGLVYSLQAELAVIQGYYERTEVAPSRAPLPIVVDGVAIDPGDPKVQAAIDSLCGAFSEAARIESGKDQGNSYTKGI